MTRTVARIAVALAVVVALLAPAERVDAAPSADLAAMYPGPRAEVPGWNYVVGAPSHLYYEADAAAGTFLQANSPDWCHFDTFRWGDTLAYLATTNRCGVDRVVIYEPGIELAPRAWDGEPWSLSGSSRVVTLNAGRVECTGRNAWTARVVGWVDVTPGERAVWLTNTQTTTWETGSCAPHVTRWAEHFFWTDAGYRRSVGGNLGGGFAWDVWYQPPAPRAPRS